jgi:SAM-dependent methyltransferase
MFREVFKKYISSYDWNEGKAYYPNHEYRYRYLMSIYSKLRKGKSEVLDIGGGQYALLAHKMYGDNTTVADVGEPKAFQYLRCHGVGAITWDLCSNYIPFMGMFDFIFFSEVLEHLPVPAYEVFKKLKGALRPGGTIICTVPNLLCLENLFSFIFNIPVFVPFRGPTGKDEGHVIMYTKEHLEWQIKRAGFKNVVVNYIVNYKYHRSILRNILFVLSFPLFLIPHFRTMLVTVLRKD